MAAQKINICSDVDNSYRMNFAAAYMDDWKLNTMHPNKTGMSGKWQRRRTNFKNWQLQELDRAFLHTQYADEFLRVQLANRIGLTEANIRVGLGLLY